MSVWRGSGRNGFEHYAVRSAVKGPETAGRRRMGDLARGGAGGPTVALLFLTPKKWGRARPDSIQVSARSGEMPTSLLDRNRNGD